MSIRLKIGISVVAVLFLAILSGTFYFYRALNAPNSNSSESTIVEVKSSTIEEVGQRLVSAKVLKSPLVFTIYSRLINKQLYAGYFKLPKNLSPKELFTSLAGENYRVYKITIPEGYRTEQIGQKLADQELVDYEKFVEEAKGKEGRLFTDTYFWAKNSDPKEIVKEMNDNFSARTKALSLSEDDLILASIVERETAGDDRNIIAGIYKNRLKIEMKLDADPTVQYAKDSNSVIGIGGQEMLVFKFWRSITAKEYYSTISDYNTYLNKGLPPAPICNPGLASINAVLNPDKNDYIYFFHVDGQIYPSRTIEEHNQKKEQYLY